MQATASAAALPPLRQQTEAARPRPTEHKARRIGPGSPARAR